MNLTRVRAALFLAAKRFKEYEEVSSSLNPTLSRRKEDFFRAALLGSFEFPQKNSPRTLLLIKVPEEIGAALPLDPAAHQLADPGSKRKIAALV
jgi:hypothetical protein